MVDRLGLDVFQIDAGNPTVSVYLAGNWEKSWGLIFKETRMPDGSIYP